MKHLKLYRLSPCRLILPGLVVLILLSGDLAAAELSIVPSESFPAIGTTLNCWIIADYALEVKGIDLRIEYDDRILELESITPVAMNNFDWQRSLIEGSNGSGITSLAFGVGSSVSVRQGDTLCVLGFRVKETWYTPVAINADYPIIIDSQLNVLRTKVNPAEIGSGVSIVDGTRLPVSIGLSAYPNPFNGRITIQIPVRSKEGRLSIYDIQGRRVWEKTVSSESSGFIMWDGSNYSGKKVASGVYIYSYNAGDLITRGKCILLR